MKNIFQTLAELGAGDFEHLDGSLIDHLQGTRDILQKWGASTVLQDAGLYHAAYGTAGFSPNLVSTDQRSRIAALIGEAAEEVVYQYCACDRQAFFDQIGNTFPPNYTNRFNGKTYYLPEKMLKDFCELTAANELEIALDNPEFIALHGAGLHQLFKNMRPYLSAPANETTRNTFQSRAD